MEKALEIVRTLEKFPESVNFLKPVDYKALGLIDYPLVIKNPMDLSTVRKKIKSEKYAYIEELLEDLILIWDNCRAYNQIGSAIVTNANYLQNKLKSICEDFGIIMNLPEKRDRNSVSFDMKVQLAEKFRMANVETLIEIVKIVELQAKPLLEKHGNKFIQIKFEDMDKVVFDKLNS